MVFGKRTKSSSTEVEQQVESNEFNQFDEHDSDDESNEDVDNNDNNNKVEQAPPLRSSIVKSFRSLRAPPTSIQSQSKVSTTSLRPPVPIQSQPVYKFGIKERLQHAVDTKSSYDDSTNYRSPDLIPLMKQFEVFRKKLRHFIQIAKKYHKSLQTFDYDRLQMAKELASFANDTPIEAYIGNNNNYTSETSENYQNDQEIFSFLSVMYEVSNVSAKCNMRYKNEILEYCIEWEQIISTWIDSDMATMKQLREMYQHYQGKVDKLRKNVNGQESKGKVVNTSLADKLLRNEEKLLEASELYEASVVPLCILLTEIVEYGYKDLIPLLTSYMKYEMDRHQHETRTFHLFQNELFEQINTHTNAVGTEPDNATRPTSTSRSSNGKKLAIVNTNQNTRNVAKSNSRKPANPTDKKLTDNNGNKYRDDDDDSNEVSESSTAYDNEDINAK